MADGEAQKTEIRQRARAAGFDAVAFARATLPDSRRADLAGFVGDGRHGDMAWMADTLDRRGHPRALWPQAVTVVALGLNYGPGGDPLPLLARGERGYVSVYARNRDYHDLVKTRLKQLARWMHETFAEDVKVFVDTAPLMEKPLAEAAGLGWCGKHTNVVSRRFGSWLFLGEVLTTLDLPPDAAEADHCGSCTRCLDICPTGAFDGPHRIDARKCISYLTIEHKGVVPRPLMPRLGNRIYGCDDCLAVCPWNRFATPARQPDLLPRVELTAPRLADLASLDEAGFRDLFRQSPVKRIGHARFLRNVLIALGNSRRPDLAAVVEARLADAAPVVRATAVWALGRLDPDRLAAVAASRAAAEPDPQVREAWRLEGLSAVGVGAGGDEKER
jgi:epoxyqueuosine reductase